MIHLAFSLKGLILHHGAALAAIAALLIALPAGPASAQPTAARAASVAMQFRQANESLEAGNADEAMKHLTTLRAATDVPEEIRYAANLLLHQLDGSFVPRQSVWLKRQHVDALLVAGSERAFADALAGWTDDRAYPIAMVENAWWTYLLHRGYEPAGVYHLASDNPLTEQQFIEIAQAHNQRLAETERPTPMPGIVVIDPTHEHRLAGLTLAVGRGQPILLVKLDDETRKASTPEAIAKLNGVILTAAIKAGVITADHWAGITLAADFPLKYTDPDRNGPMAVDDLLGRDAKGLRLAVVGRFWGTRDAAIYQAMCSLFLQPKRALLFDDYTNRGGTFVSYRMAGAAKLLAEHLRVAEVVGEQVTPAALGKLTAAQPPFDLVMINSSGGAFNFDLRGKGSADELSLGYPRIYHVIHSFSAQKPQNTNTLAGRALLGGGYWYFGSVDEPYLHAFARPTGMIAKYLAGTPLAFAARQHPGQPMYRPWKLMLFGDPLLAWRAEPADRIAEGVPEAAKAIDAGDPTIGEWSIGSATIGIPAEDRPKSLREMSPTQISVMVYETIRQGQGSLLVKADDTQLRRSGIARMLMQGVLRTAVANAIAANQLDEAGNLLTRWLAMANSSKQIEHLLNRWLIEMAKANREAEATLWMQLLDKKRLTRAAKKVIEKKLTPPEPEEQPEQDEQ